MGIEVKVELIDRVILVRWLQNPIKEDVEFLRATVARMSRTFPPTEPPHYIGMSGDLGALSDEQTKLAVSYCREALPLLKSMGLVIEGTSLK